MKVNLHTHTYRCNHAHGTDEEFVLAAIDAGYTKLGFSDHNPFPYDNGYYNKQKMLPDMLDSYIADIRLLQEKYKDQIEILVGLECDSATRFFPYLQEISGKLDYMILGGHGDWSIGELYSGRLDKKWQLHKYFATTVEGMETGMFLYLAHPDLMLGSYREFDDTAQWLSRELCREANRLGLPLEYNMYGLQKTAKPGTLGYPYTPFWEIAAEENVQAVIGVDAHRPENFKTSDVEAARKLLEGLGLTVLQDPMSAKK